MKQEKILIGLLTITVISDKLIKHDLGLIIGSLLVLIALNYLPFTIGRLLVGNAWKTFGFKFFDVDFKEFVIAFLFCLNLCYFTISVLFYWFELPDWNVNLIQSAILGFPIILAQRFWINKWGSFFNNRYLIMILITTTILLLDGSCDNFHWTFEKPDYHSFISEECRDLNEIDEALSCAKKYDQKILVVVSDGYPTDLMGKIENFKDRILRGFLLLELSRDEQKIELRNGFHVMDSKGVIERTLPLNCTYAELSLFLKK